MTELAPLRLSMPTSLGWEQARIPAAELPLSHIRHVKLSAVRASAETSALELPRSGLFAAIGTVDVLGIGPGEWLLTAADSDKEPLSAIERRLSDLGALIADAQARLLVLGLNIAADVLCGLTGLAAEALRPGCVARTRLADMPITIAAMPGGEFRLFLDRSHASHFRVWLDRAL